MTGLFTYAFGLGIAFCAAPGTVMSESIRRGLARGFWPALTLQLGSLIGDATWAIIGLTGANLLIEKPAVKALLLGFGLLLIGHLALSAARDAWRGHIPTSSATAARGDFLTGVLLSLTNPATVVYWLALSGVLVAFGIKTPEMRHYTIFFAGFMAACLVWCFIVSVIVTWGRSILTPVFYRCINGGCALLLTAAAIVAARTLLKILP